MERFQQTNGLIQLHGGLSLRFQKRFYIHAPDGLQPSYVHPLCNNTNTISSRILAAPLVWCFALHDRLRDTGSPMISLARRREMAAELAPAVFCVLGPFGPETSW